MALDDQAVLQLTVEVREGQAQMAAFVESYKADMQALLAATKAGVDPASAEFQELRARALDSGSAVLRAGQQGVEAMTALAVATGKPTAELKELQGQLNVTRGQLRQMRQETTGGAGGFDLLGANIDKVGSKFKTFATGLGVGLVLTPIIAQISKLQEGLEEGLGLWQQYTAEAIAGGDSLARLGEGSKRLSTAQRELAELQRHLTEEEARAIIVREGSALSVDQLADAIESHHGAQLKIEDDYRKEIAAANSLVEVSAAVEKRRRALAAAARDYTDAVTGQLAVLEREVEVGKQFAAQQNAELQSRRSIRDEVLGNADALGRETEALLAVIERAREQGTVTKEQAAKIKEAVAEQLAAYEEYGLKVPPGLQTVIDQLGILTAAQQKARESAEAFAQVQLKAIENNVRAQQAENQPAIQGQQDAQGRVDSLKQEVAALEEQNDAAVVTLEQSEELAEKKRELKDAEIDLNRATLANVNALQTQGDAAEIAKNRMAELVNQWSLAHGEIDEFGNVIRGSDDALLALAKNTSDHGAIARDNAVAVNDQADAIAGLAEREREAGIEADIVAEASQRAGTAVESLGEKSKKAGEEMADSQKAAREDLEAYEAVLDRLADSKLPKIIDLVRAWRREQGGAAATAPLGG